MEENGSYSWVPPQPQKERKLPDFGKPAEKVSYLDGCKVYFRDGWVILRFSGTEPRIRIFAEAPTTAPATIPTASPFPKEERFL